MGWWIYLKGPDGEPIAVDAHVEGGTHVLGGTDRAELNVTYNYSRLFYRSLDPIEFPDGFRSLNGMSAAHALPFLKEALAKLGDTPSGDYWEDIPGNAGHVLSILIKWVEAACRQEHPATFEVR